MAQNRMMPPALLEQLQGADTDVLRRVLEHAMQRLIEAEASTQIGAGPHERASTRTTYRNGYRERILDTGSGRLELQIPRLRTGSFFPTLLEPRRRIDRALLAAVQEAYVLGISTRKVDDLMAALGGCSISRSEVSRICALLDEELAEFRERPLDEPYPYVWFDATYEKVRQGARIVSQAAVVAVGVRDTGEKSVLGLAIGASETEAFWLEFCRSLARRGLSGVQLVISDAHEGLRSALSQVFAGATWQRCKVHFLRNVASAVPKLHAPAVLAVVKSIFLQPTRETSRDAVNHALSVLEPRFPTVAAKLRAAEADVLAYLDFPVDHWRSISSTNAIERVNAELDRRAKVVGIFPNSASLLRLFTAVLQDQHDEWQDGRRHFSQQSMARVLHPDGPPLLTNPLTEGLVA
ncbi:MAG: IS256 family transposase [Candidatus Dormiibacterota bacterium]